jgi:hypothetical protein
VAGLVPVYGRASSSTFFLYRLEFGEGIAPQNWQVISQSTNRVESGPLGGWNTQGLTSGLYTLRLVVQDRSGGQVVATVSVSVGAPSPTPIATGTPIGRP